MLLCAGLKPLPFKGKGLGPVHRSTGLVEILTHVQKLDKIRHACTKSQLVQCSCALNLSHSPSKGKDWVLYIGALDPLRS